MPTKVQFDKVMITQVEAEIPDRCPKCGADLAEPGSVLEGNYNYCNVRGHMDPESNEFEPEGESDFTDEYHPIGYLCAECEHTLAGEGIDSPTEPEKETEAP